MKRLLSLLLAFSVVFTLFVGCSKTPEAVETESTTEAEKASITVVIDGNKFTEDFSEEDFYETLNSIDGLFHTKNTETNKYTLQMTASAYSTLREIKAKEVYNEFDELKNNTENYVTDIKNDDDFRNVTIVADRKKTPEEISVLDDVVIKVASASMAYQIYTVNGQSVKITIIYSDTEEIAKEISFPIVIE